jgi:alginate O-acetyltransferase complex protein AlgI
MLFNSVNFLIFLPIVFTLYWLVAVRGLRFQNILLLCANYFFYASWDYRFLFLLIFSTFLDYYSGIKISEAPSQKLKKVWLWISITINLGFLGVFKYFNFFVDSFANGLSLLGVQVNLWTLNMILPVGISFYTFHGLSYIIDIYKSKIKPERNFIDYSVFVSFFPLLVAGPIERAQHLLPQIKEAKKFNYSKAVDGLRQIVWGLFKKIVIADNCGEYASVIFNNPGQYSGSTVFVGVLFFSFQIYCDFSGYSDIALGTARLFGVELLRNFSFPYFSRDVAEFWRRWHISLTTWFRDYLYIPLGGNAGSRWVTIRNVFIVFLVSGLWHGANWTFVIWGALNALFILPLILLGKNRDNLDVVASKKLFPSFNELVRIIFTFGLINFAWIFFRARDLNEAFVIVSKLFSVELFRVPQWSAFASATTHPLITICLLLLFVLMEWLGREQSHTLHYIALKWPRPLRYALYYVLVACIFSLSGINQEFIYFQF